MNTYRKCYLIPPDEKQCVWMSAGIVAYQLCDLTYDCDNCPTDQAMRKRFSNGAGLRPGEAGSFSRAFNDEIPQEGFRFSRNHWWVRPIGLNLFRLGIETGLARALQGVRGIVLPQLEQSLREGQTCVWIILDGGTVPLEAPLNGSVKKLNNELLSRPSLFSLQPFQDGWLYEIEADDAESQASYLMTADEARPHYASDQNRFLTSLTSAIRGKRSQVGLTLADGGEKLQNLIAILGSARYIALIRQHFSYSKRQ